jgi:hypothetical protein
VVLHKQKQANLQRVEMARKALSKTNATIKRTAKTLNKIDQQLGGLVLANPISKAVVPYANALATAVDYFDELMPTAGVTHPQITNGVVAGVSQTMAIRRSKPRITGSRGSIRIVHKELVGEIVTAVGGMSTSALKAKGESIYHLSPTNTHLFPWLSRVARNYDYFRFNRVRFVYVPLCSTSTTGRVMLGYDPDAADAVPNDRSALSSYSCSIDSSAWGVTKLDAKLPNNQPWFQTNDITAASMYSTSAMGQAFWASWGAGQDATVGELYVLYEVVLKDPQPNENSSYRATGNGVNVVSDFPPASPATIMSTDNTIVLSMFATGTFNIIFHATTTQTTANITAVASGGVTGDTTFIKIGDGTEALGCIQVNVTNVGYNFNGTLTFPSQVTFGSLAALGTYEVTIMRDERTSDFP